MTHSVIPNLYNEKKASPLIYVTALIYGRKHCLLLNVRQDLFDEPVQRQELDIAQGIHLPVQGLQQFPGLRSIFGGNVDDVLYSDVEEMTYADDPLQGEVPLASLQLGIILRVQVEMLGQLLLGHIVQQTVFFDVLRYGVRCVLFHSGHSLSFKYAVRCVKK